MLKSEIESTLMAQANEMEVDLGMTRECLSNIPCQDKFATIITGVRRCGKSTLLRQWASQTDVHESDHRATCQ